MMCQRELTKLHGDVFRYIASDASPQQSQSIEIFVTVERVVPRSVIMNASLDNFDTGQIVHRILPLTTLGHGKTDLASKVIAQVIRAHNKTLH